MADDLRQRDACPGADQHTPHPASYGAHWEWAEQMLLTHDQRLCPGGCGLWAVWEPQPGVTDLARPALYTGNCSHCDGWISVGDPIRTDGQGGWIGGCCPPDATPTQPLKETGCRAVHLKTL